MRALYWPLLTIGALLAEPASAGAWTRAEGAVFAALSGRMHKAGDYEKTSSDILLEYGAFDSVTLGAALGVEQDTAPRRETVARGFVRFRLWRADAAVLSAAVGGEAVLSSSNAGGPFVEKGSDGARLSLAYGRGLETPLGPGWADAEATFRKRLGADADEFRLALTAGIRPTENWVAYAQAFATAGLRNARGEGSDYDLLKLSASVGYRITESRTLVLSATRDIGGRNIRAGYEAALTVWFDY